MKINSYKLYTSHNSSHYFFSVSSVNISFTWREYLLKKNMKWKSRIT